MFEITMEILTKLVTSILKNRSITQALIAGDYTEALEYYDRSLIYKPTTAVYNNRALLCELFIGVSCKIIKIIIHIVYCFRFEAEEMASCC